MLFSFFDSNRANLEKAMALSQKALELDPELAEAHVARGRAFYHSGRYDEAEKLYRETLEIQRRVLGQDHPDSLQATRNLVNLYEAWGKLDKAAEWRAKLPSERKSQQAK